MTFNLLSQKQLRAKLTAQLKTSADPVERIRLTALLRGPGGIRDIGRIFRNMDDDNSGNISFEEFQRGVNEIGVILDQSEMEVAYNEIDNDRSGTISYQEFLEHLRDKIMNGARQDIVKKVFNKLDNDLSGFITVDDLRGVYDVSRHPKVKSGEWSETKALEQFLLIFDTPDNFDGTVTKDEFYSYYAGVSASINKDEDFITMMQTLWQLEDESKNKKPLIRLINFVTNKKPASAEKGGVDKKDKKKQKKKKKNKSR